MLDVVEADEEGDGSEDAEAGVDETPGERDAAHRAGDEGERKHADAGDDSELQDPFVADGVDEWADEGDCEDEVGEGQPVSAVGEEWCADAVVEQSLVDAVDPEDNALRQDRMGGEE